MSRAADAGSHGHAHGDPAHGHAHGHGAPTSGAALGAAFVLTGTFMVVEAAVGWWSGSLALVADAGHMLSDTGALGLALLAQRWATRPRTMKSTFGYRRAEVLAAFVNGILLALLSVWVVVEAVSRWSRPLEIRGVPMLIAAVAGLAVNAFVAGILFRAREESVNVRAALLHVVSDAFGSVGAIAAAVSVLVFDEPRADPALSLFIAGLVAWSGWRVLRETTGILLEAAPAHLDVAAIEKTILESPGVATLHDLHVWRISDRFDALTVHVTLAAGSHGVEVARSVRERLHDRHGLEHVTVQPEAPEPGPVAIRRGKDGPPMSKG